MKNVFKMTAIATSIMASSVTFAAVEGTGTSTVDLEVPNALEMTTPSDLELTYTAGSDVTGTSTFAVCQNFSSGFTVSVTENLGLSDNSGNTIAVSASGGMAEGATTQSIAACDSDPNENGEIAISISADNIDAAPAGSYSGSVTVQVGAL